MDARRSFTLWPAWDEENLDSLSLLSPWERFTCMSLPLKDKANRFWDPSNENKLLCKEFNMSEFRKEQRSSWMDIQYLWHLCMEQSVLQPCIHRDCLSSKLAVEVQLLLFLVRFWAEELVGHSESCRTGIYHQHRRTALVLVHCVHWSL